MQHPARFLIAETQASQCPVLKCKGIRMIQPRMSESVSVKGSLVHRTVPLLTLGTLSIFADGLSAPRILLSGNWAVIPAPLLAHNS